MTYQIHKFVFTFKDLHLPEDAFMKHIFNEQNFSSYLLIFLYDRFGHSPVCLKPPDPSRGACFHHWVTRITSASPSIGGKGIHVRIHAIKYKVMQMFPIFCFFSKILFYGSFFTVAKNPTKAHNVRHENKLRFTSVARGCCGFKIHVPYVFKLWKKKIPLLVLF